jgi:two-component system OmpR family sensor kinase
MQRRIERFIRSAAARRVARDVVIVLVGMAFGAGPCRMLDERLPLAKVTLVMSLFAAMAGVAAALLAALCVRLTATGRFGWLSMALGCYSLVAIPTATIGSLDTGLDPAIAAVWFLVHCLIVGLLLVALLELRPPIGRRAVSTLLCAGGLVIGAATLGMALPMITYWVTSFQPFQLAVALSMTAVALALAVLAVRQEAWGLWYVALGFAVLGLAKTARVSVAGSPVADLGLGFSTIRLSGVILALWGTLFLMRQALTRLDDEHETHEEELRLAEIRLVRTAERDHELRSGLAGLASATSLFTTNRPDAPFLSTVVASEISRLDDLLRAPPGIRNDAGIATYAVAPVLTGLVALRRSSGMDIRLDMDPGLQAVGSSATLAQVITNLVANAARHAPGSPVWISATRRPRQVVICIRDCGPGVPPGRERAVFSPGVHDRCRNGLGLGLTICRDLLSAENGSITIPPADPKRPGCVAIVELPAGRPALRAVKSLRAVGVPCGS